jgi:hypothetical protein
VLERGSIVRLSAIAEIDKHRCSEQAKRYGRGAARAIFRIQHEKNTAQSKACCEQQPVEARVSIHKPGQTPFQKRPGAVSNQDTTDQYNDRRHEWKIAHPELVKLVTEINTK